MNAVLHCSTHDFLYHILIFQNFDFHNFETTVLMPFKDYESKRDEAKIHQMSHVKSILQLV